MMLYQHLKDFHTLVYTIGDGCPPDKDGVNALSRANAERAAELTLQIRDAILFIAGGNGGEHGVRGSKEKGSLQEAPRMVNYIREQISQTIPIITDCDREFQRIIGAQASMNTIENSRNAALVLQAGELRSVVVVAERLHMLRVIGTLRAALQNFEINGVLMRAHPTDGVFEETNDQPHIRSKKAFKAWNRKANIHHLLIGAVPRAEFLKELVTNRKYRQFYADEDTDS